MPSYFSNVCHITVTQENVSELYCNGMDSNGIE